MVQINEKIICQRTPDLRTNPFGLLLIGHHSRDYLKLKFTFFV